MQTLADNKFQLCVVLCLCFLNGLLDFDKRLFHVQAVKVESIWGTVSIVCCKDPLPRLSVEAFHGRLVLMTFLA